MLDFFKPQQPNRKWNLKKSSVFKIKTKTVDNLYVYLTRIMQDVLINEQTFIEKF